MFIKKFGYVVLAGAALAAALQAPVASACNRIINAYPLRLTNPQECRDVVSGRTTALGDQFQAFDNNPSATEYFMGARYVIGGPNGEAFLQILDVDGHQIGQCFVIDATKGDGAHSTKCAAVPGKVPRKVSIFAI
jgi:hypothetical protein